LLAAAILLFYHGEYKRMHLEKGGSTHHPGLLPTIQYDENDTEELIAADEERQLSRDNNRN
jgi:hypothetical protein